jgi:error-prone DNA polymerase
MAEGHLQIEKEVVHVIVQRCHNLNRLLVGLTPSQEEEAPLYAAGEAVRSAGGQVAQPRETGEVKQASLFPEARNFK